MTKSKLCKWCKAKEKTHDALISLCAVTRETVKDNPRTYCKASLEGNCAVIVAANFMISNISYCQCKKVEES